MKILIYYGYMPNTPGRYLEDAFVRMGAIVHRNKPILESYDMGIWVESPSKPMPRVTMIPRPFVCWIHHGLNRFKYNKKIIDIIEPDLVLMSHSLNLAAHLKYNVAFFPFACDPIFNSKKPWNKRKYLTGFVGVRTPSYSNRRAVLNRVVQITNKFHKKSIITSGVYREDMARIYNDCKIVLNPVHNTIQSINMRLWEGMGCGAFMLSDSANGQELLFKDNEHYMIMNNLNKQIAWIVANDGLARQIAQNGYQTVKKYHTYEHRISLLFKLLNM